MSNKTDQIVITVPKHVRAYYLARLELQLECLSDRGSALAVANVTVETFADVMAAAGQDAVLRALVDRYGSPRTSYYAPVYPQNGNALSASELVDRARSEALARIHANTDDIPSSLCGFPNDARHNVLQLQEGPFAKKLAHACRRFVEDHGDAAFVKQGVEADDVGKIFFRETGLRWSGQTLPPLVISDATYARLEEAASEALSRSVADESLPYATAGRVIDALAAVARDQDRADLVAALTLPVSLEQTPRSLLANTLLPIYRSRERVETALVSRLTNLHEFEATLARAGFDAATRCYLRDTKVARQSVKDMLAHACRLQVEGFPPSPRAFTEADTELPYGIDIALSPGDWVRHSKFGRGYVLSVIEGRAEIDFDGVTKKLGCQSRSSTS